MISSRSAFDSGAALLESCGSSRAKASTRGVSASVASATFTPLFMGFMVASGSAQSIRACSRQAEPRAGVETSFADLGDAV
ncbi:hypothetical protein D3C81_2203470 [compost metagenome]